LHEKEGGTNKLGNIDSHEYLKRAESRAGLRGAWGVTAKGPGGEGAQAQVYKPPGPIVY
jgi:hypothetical protein